MGRACHVSNAFALSGSDLLALNSALPALTLCVFILPVPTLTKVEDFSGVCFRLDCRHFC